MKKSKKGKARRIFEKLKGRAGKIITNPQKTKEVIDQARNKSSNNKGPLSEVWHELQLMFNMVRDWIRGDYRNAPVGSIIAIIGGLLYLIMPFDAIPDFIPVAGLIDDVYILNLVIKQVRADLNDYKVWVGEDDIAAES
ncbi:YkvA family protein [Halobacillus campisalis]|uniref:YkvA family protein n=1 Tax=Halobacillus campisalis TaxID=435909 RepID=A0ABW2K7T6_9BACI|nr:YkvA family protein [Halobacillus campisalis]